MTTPTPQVAPVYALTPGEVNVGTPNGAGIYLAPTGTAGPADTVTAWPVGWNILGYCSDAGPTIGQNTTKQDLTPWQSIAPLRSVITAHEITLHFILWQINALTLGLYFDTNQVVPAGDGSLVMACRTDQSGHRYSVGIDQADGGRVMHVWFPMTGLTDAGDMAITRASVVPLECTMTAVDSAGVLANVLMGPSRVGGLMMPSDNGTGADNGHELRKAGKAA